MPELTLYRGGRLIKTPWDEPDSEDARDVSHEASCYVMDLVSLHEDVRLIDVFTLLRKDPILVQLFARHWSKDYLEASFKLEAVTIASAIDSSDIEYLELYRSWVRDTKTNVLENIHNIELTGVGVLLQQDHVEHGEVIGKAGSRIRWGLCRRPVKSLLALPLRHNPHVAVSEGCLDDTDKYDTEIDCTTIRFLTLGEILKGIFDEVAANGSPDDAADFNEQLKDLANEARALYTDQ